MSRRKVFYRLEPKKTKRYRKPKAIVFAYVRADTIEDRFIDASIIVGDSIYELDSAYKPAQFIKALPSGTWIITWNIDNWFSCASSLIKEFDVIDGVHDSKVVELRCGDSKWSIVDLFQFYPDALHKIVNKAWPDIILRRPDSRTAVIYIMKLWFNLAELLETEYFTYPSKTPGSTALKIFKTFLKDSIPTHGYPILTLTRQALRSPAMHWKSGYYPNSYMYDINAAYVHVMRVLKYPLKLRSFIDTPPPTNRWIARVKLDYHTDKEFAPLPVFVDGDEEDDGFSVYPTDIKDLICTITYVDLFSMSVNGNVTVKEWYEGVYWDARDESYLFSEWADSIEEVSSRSESNKIALKIVSRALHSKFSPKRYYEHNIVKRVGPDEYKRLVNAGKVAKDFILDDGELAILYKFRQSAGFVPYEHPEWEALTLAMARYMIYSVVDNNTIYVNTDCIISTVPRDDIPISPAYGAWKLKEQGPCYIAGLGLYVIGSEMAHSGVKAPVKTTKEAIMSAAKGIEWVISLLNKQSAFTNTNPHGTFSVRQQKYPLSTAKGGYAYVTRSPTKKLHIKYNPPAMRASGRERVVKEIEDDATNN